MSGRRTRENHDAVVVEIVYAVLSSAVLGAAAGLAVYLVARFLGVDDVAGVEVAAVGLALGVWCVRTFVVLLSFDRAGRSAT